MNDETKRIILDGFDEVNTNHDVDFLSFCKGAEFIINYLIQHGKL